MYGARGELNWERIAVAAVVLFLGGLLTYGLIATLSSASDNRDQAKEFQYESQSSVAQMRDVVQALTKLEGKFGAMGDELKGLSSNIETAEATCHKVARKSKGSKRHPANAFQHYQFCMSHHGWRPVGWKG